MKLVMMTYNVEEDCKLCQKLRTKWGRIQKERERIKRWKKESGRKASIANAEETIEKLEGEITELQQKKYDQEHNLG